MFGLRALGALPYTGRPETAVSNPLKWYLKWPATTGTNNKALVQLSGIGTSSYLTLVFAEDVIDPSSTSYIYDGRRTLDTVTEGNGGYFLEMSNAVQVNGVSNITLNGVASNNTAWRTAKAGDAYKFFFDAGLDGVISVGGRFNEIEGFPLLALRTIIVDDANGSHVIDLTNKAGLTQFTSNDGVITAKLFGFSIGACWVPYLDTTVSTPIINQGVSGTANYFCTLNGTSYFTAPTLGNLLTGSPKIRINIKKFKYTSTGVQPIFWQGSGSAGGREFGLRANYRGNVDFFYGGNSYSISWATLTAAFGDPDLTCDEFGFEIDGTTIRYYKNKVVVLDLPNAFGRQGTARIDGALLFFGARPNTDSGGAFTAQDICAAGTQYGDIEILINDVLVRNYKNTNGNGAGYVDVLQPRPFALRYNAGGNRYMALPQAIIIADNQDFEIEFECAFNNDTDFRIFGATAGVNNRVILLKGTGATVVRLTPTSGTANDWTVTYTKTDFNVFRFRRVSNILELFVNGVSQGTKTESSGFTSGVNSFFTQGGFYSDSGTVRFLKFTIGGVLQHHYVNLTGSGTSWTDIVSGNNATPINTWPTDNSQWIEYAHLQQRGTFTIDNNEWRQYIVSSGPSGQASSTLNIPFKKFDVAASFQNIKPTSSTALDMAFKKFVVNSSLQSLPPQSQTTVAMTFNQFAVLVSGETTKPVFNSTANINFKKFGILVDGSSGKPTSSITISSTFKKFNAAITGQSVKPTSSVDANITFKKFAISSSGQSVRPQTNATVTTVFKKFSVASSLEFTKPVFNSTVAATFKSFNVAASIDSDVPLFNTSISITMPAFGVSVIMGDVKFFGSDGTHYEHEALSTTSQYEAGSTVDYAPYFSTHTEWRL